MQERQSGKESYHVPSTALSPSTAFVSIPAFQLGAVGASALFKLRLPHVGLLQVQVSVGLGGGQRGCALCLIRGNTLLQIEQNTVFVIC